MLTIALHGDLGNSKMMERDVGDLASSIDVFWNAHGWVKFNEQFDRLMEYCRQLHEPPILIGYSRGGSVIAALSYMGVKIRAAVLYESPIVDSAGVGGSFPVLMIWNDRGAKASIWGRRRREVKSTEATWKETHPVEPLDGKGEHMQVRPYPAHCWDVSLNDQIREWLKHA